MQRKKTLALAAATAAAAVLAVVQPFSATAAPTADPGQAPLTTQQASDLAQNVEHSGDRADEATSRRRRQRTRLPRPTASNTIRAFRRRWSASCRRCTPGTCTATRSPTPSPPPSRQARRAGSRPNPDVAAVLPDSVIKEQAATPSGKAASAADTTAPAGVCPAPGKTMLEPEALADTHTDSDDPNAKTARSLGFDGCGREGRLHRRRHRHQQPGLHPGQRPARLRRLPGLHRRRSERDHQWWRGVP